MKNTTLNSQHHQPGQLQHHKELQELSDEELLSCSGGGALDDIYRRLIEIRDLDNLRNKKGQDNALNLI